MTDIERHDPAKKPRAREALLEAAERLFIEKSYEAVSTRELTEAAGVNLAAIQYHFGSKAKLFVETIHRMMQGSACAGTHNSLDGKVETRQDAATHIARFVRSFLGYLLNPEGPQACRLMFREILSSTSSQDKELSEALITSFIEHFIMPLESSMSPVLRVLHPEAEAPKLHLFCRSIVGQCVFYVTHRGFLERLYDKNLGDTKLFNTLVTHVCEFSLHGLGCKPDEIEVALSQETL